MNPLVKKFHFLVNAPTWWVDQNSIFFFLKNQPGFEIFLVAIWQQWTLKGHILDIFLNISTVKGRKKFFLSSSKKFLLVFFMQLYVIVVWNVIWTTFFMTAKNQLFRLNVLEISRNIPKTWPLKVQCCHMATWKFEELCLQMMDVPIENELWW